MEKNKKIIIDIFNANVKGKKYKSTGYHKRHDGAEGHWLEKQMGIKPNANNEADLLGYEMKKDTTSKTTFGDWSPDVALWKNKKPYENIDVLDRDNEFLKYFGKPNESKGGRFSWSGEPVPTIRGYNSFGQILCVDNNDNIVAYYSYSKDSRFNKDKIIPIELQQDKLVLAKWLKEPLKQKLEKKFNESGWFKCFKDDSGAYTSIGFGNPINYDSWIDLVRQGIVFFDSGMYATNKRPYSQWRAVNNYWDSLITDIY